MRAVPALVASLCVVALALHFDRPIAPQAATPTRAALTTPDPSGDPVYICPMDPDMRSSRPGVCRRCGMTLLAGIPDPVQGEAVKAWVVLRPGQRVSESEIRAFCREHLAPYKIPSTVAFRTDLPKTMVGKVLRRALKEAG